MTIFQDIQFAVEFGFLSFKKKIELKNKIIENGGILSYIITKHCKYLVLCELDKLESSSKCRIAMKMGVPIVSPDYLDACIKNGFLIGEESFLLGEQNKMEAFKQGKIAHNLAIKKSQIKKKAKFSLLDVKLWDVEDINAPRFPDIYHIAKWVILTKSVKSNKDQERFQILELHALEEENRKTVEYPFRIFIHSCDIKSNKEHLYTSETRECCYFDCIDTVLAAFCQFYNKKIQPPSNYTRAKQLNRFISPNFGSPNFYKIVNEHVYVRNQPVEEVLELVEHIWQEAIEQMKNLSTVDLYKLDPNKIIEAEGILLQIREKLKEKASLDEVHKLSDEFYNLLNLSQKNFDPISTHKILIKNHNLCQLLKDVWSVSEGTNWKSLSVIAKYSALQCSISLLDKNEPEFINIKNMILGYSNDKVKVQIHNIFKVNRVIEDDNFVHEMQNKQLLFHGTPPSNILGILFRGLLLPNKTGEEFGVERTDEGKLGSGIYFSNSLSYSLTFSSATQMKGTNLLLVYEVALGNCEGLTTIKPSLQNAPEGFDSVHGLKNLPNNPTEFEENEFVIYKLNQQRVKYLVEFSETNRSIKKVTFSTEEEMDDIPNEEQEKIALSDVKDILNPLTTTKVGLVGNNDSLPLKKVHVRALLANVIAEVIIFQSYVNETPYPIEAKYVFPLNDLATVVGFEAFINDKHIIGTVKEKKTAHKEYKQAIEEGHGAYLMDQEAPDVFTVSVGNLPPKAKVLIKITYVEELSTEGDSILFFLPGSMAPWKKDAALTQEIQNAVPTLSMKDKTAEKTSIEISVDMLHVIKSISSPSHSIKFKV